MKVIPIVAMEMKKDYENRVGEGEGVDEEDDDTIKSFEGNKPKGSQHNSQSSKQCEIRKKFTRATKQKPFISNLMTIDPSTTIATIRT